MISFVMKFEQLNFPEAMKLLAGRVHIELPESGFQRTEKSKADLLYQVYDLAQTFYHSYFLKSPAAEKVRQTVAAATWNAFWKTR